MIFVFLRLLCKVVLCAPIHVTKDCLSHSIHVANYRVKVHRVSLVHDLLESVFVSQKVLLVLWAIFDSHFTSLVVKEVFDLLDGWPCNLLFAPVYFLHLLQHHLEGRDSLDATGVNVVVDTCLSQSLILSQASINFTVSLALIGSLEFRETCQVDRF